MIPLVVSVLNCTVTFWSFFQAEKLEEKLQSVAYIMPTAFLNIILLLLIGTFLERWTFLYIVIQSMLYAVIFKYKVIIEYVISHMIDIR